MDLFTPDRPLGVSHSATQGVCVVCGAAVPWGLQLMTWEKTPVCENCGKECCTDAWEMLQRMKAYNEKKAGKKA